MIALIIVIGMTMLWQFLPEPATTPSTNLMFEDDFDDADSGWPTRYDERAEFVYKESEYHMQVNEVGHLTYVSNSDAGPFSDFTLQIDARLVSGTERTDYGIAFRRQDRDNFYLFSISPEGNYAVVKQVKGEWYPLETGNSTFIRGGNNTNKLRVICNGSEIQLYVNENHITTITDASLNEGYVGMMVGVREQPYGRAAFDSLKVSRD